VYIYIGLSASFDTRANVDKVWSVISHARVIEWGYGMYHYTHWYSECRTHTHMLITRCDYRHGTWKDWRFCVGKKHMLGYHCGSCLQGVKNYNRYCTQTLAHEGYTQHTTRYPANTLARCWWCQQKTPFTPSFWLREHFRCMRKTRGECWQGICLCNGYNLLIHAYR
jgi:hypothetical protein